MAILGKHEVTITSGGTVLQEHDPDADAVAAVQNDSSYKDTPIVLKYIEAMPGANFELNYALKEEFSFGKADYVVFRTSIDGKKVESPVVTIQRYCQTGAYSSSRGGVRGREGSQSQERPYYWKELLTTDEKPNAIPAEVKKKYAQLGRIEVSVLRKKGAKSLSHKAKKDVLPSDEPIPEEALKGRAIDSTMGLQDPRPVGGSTDWIGVKVDACPLAVFIFQYRSRKALQILGILPRTPEPVPLEARDPDSLTLDEARELLRRQMAEREAARVKIKKENAEENLRQLSAIQVKREHVDEDEGVSIVAPPAKKPRAEPEVIELSD
ncbi:hypothetical protein PV11_07052 [Exophiala sideris]|uniref:DUF7918 domain-containing protein n=1 Tax=Exophiala sideris TaxID=1016849 RepID=A0A0D1Y9C1_9EURO|nr:hypothetical protein PV11_07052 [Exophiala sideris]